MTNTKKLIAIIPALLLIGCSSGSNDSPAKKLPVNNNNQSQEKAESAKLEGMYQIDIDQLVSIQVEFIGDNKVRYYEEGEFFCNGEITSLSQDLLNLELNCIDGESYSIEVSDIKAEITSQGIPVLVSSTFFGNSNKVPAFIRKIK